MLFALFQLDERTKKIILVLCALFILLLLIFGFIYYIISKYMKKQALKVDQYMYDLCLYKIIVNPKQFKKAVIYYENRDLFDKSRWMWRIVLGLTLIVFLIGLVIFKDLKGVFSDFFLLFPTPKWQTIGEVNEKLKEASEHAILISGPSWLPTSVFPSFISKNPDYSSASLWISTIYYIVTIVCSFRIIAVTLTFISRIHHGFKMSKSVFQKNLSSLNMGTILAQEEYKQVMANQNNKEINNNDISQQ